MWNHPADVFQQLLYFIYSGRTKTPLTEDNVQPLYVAAEKYDTIIMGGISPPIASDLHAQNISNVLEE